MIRIRLLLLLCLVMMISFVSAWKLKAIGKRILLSTVILPSLLSLPYPSFAHATVPIGVLVCNDKTLTIDYINEGGSGTIFKGTDKSKPHQVYVVKRSHASTVASVQKEVKILKALQASGVGNVETFVDACYQPTVQSDSNANGNKNEFVALYQPYFTPPEVSSLAAIPHEDIRVRVTKELIKTVTQILHANWAITDLQLLIEPDTARLLLIDLTESYPLEQGVGGVMNKSAVLSFIGEAVSFIEEAQASSTEAGQSALKQAALQGVNEAVKSFEGGDDGLDKDIVLLLRENIEDRL